MSKKQNNTENNSANKSIKKATTPLTTPTQDLKQPDTTNVTAKASINPPKATKPKTASKTPPKKPTKPRQKTLNLKAVEKQYKDLSKLSIFPLDEETNTVIKYYAKFDEIKIQELLKLTYEHLMHVQENELSFFSTDEEFLHYIHYMIIFKFTTVVDNQDLSFDDHIDIMGQIVSTGLFNICFSEIFDGNEVLKILDRLQEFTNVANKLANLEEDTRAELEARVVNREILNQVSKTNKVIHPLVNPIGIE